MPSTIWPDPYRDVEKMRFQTWTGRQDHNLLQSIIPDDGFLTFLVRSTFNHFANYARTNGISFTNHPERLVAYITDRLCDGTNSQPTGPSAQRDVGDRTPSIRRDNETASDVGGSIACKTAGRRQTTKGGKK
jgi:hypothetical protein